jgi:signal transduction histidine kinase/DNA-binding response OmpR family regulator
MTRPADILLVEDNPGDARLVRELLREQASHRITVAPTLREGLEHAAGASFRAVLLDLGLPDSQGLETFTRLQAAAPHLPVVVLTGNDDDEVALRAIRAGAQDYLVKGQLDAASLVRTVRYARERAEAQATIAHLNQALQSVRRINQLIVRERDPHHLVQRACEILCEARGHVGAWIRIFGDASEEQPAAEAPPAAPGAAEAPPAALGAAGWSAGQRSHLEQVGRGWEPPCGTRVRDLESAPFRIRTRQECGECPVAREGDHEAVALVRLRHDQREYGVMHVAVAEEKELDGEERSLLLELAGDLAFALRNIAAERDARAQKAQIAELERQQQRTQRLETIGQLAGGVAHDFNNLLTVINSYTSFALSELEEKSPLREDLQQVLGAGKRASALTRQLLAFSRKQVLQPKILDLNEVVVGLDRMLGRVIGEDVTIRTRLSEDLGRVSADPAQLEQVLMNLVVNARDAMPRGGTLTVTTANAQLDVQTARRHHPDGRPGRYVVLSVADTGEGMDAETRERVFEPFFTTKTKDQGTGLGLATVYGIVRQSEGAIEVESQPGRGATFRIFLPRVEQDPHPTPRFDRVATALQGSETILVVEDEDAVRKLTARILESAGYVVLTAADGHEAIRLCEQEGRRLDLLLTDVVMPEMSGREVAERLIRYAARAGASFRVLFMSGYTDNAIAQHGVLDEDTALLAKPFTVPDLLQAVRRVLDGDFDGDRVGPTHDPPPNPAPTGAPR